MDSEARRDMIDTENDILNAEDADLLLYVAGELGGADRVALESRLKTDAQLRSRLDAMAELDTFMRADASVRPVDPTDSRVALTNTIRLVREQALLLQNRPPLRMPSRRLVGVPRWVWGTAVAASVAVGALVWISNSEPPQSKPVVVAQGNNNDTSPFAGRGDFIAFASGFLPIEAEGSESPVSEINNELDALDTLAMMEEPFGNEISEANPTR